ncbi:NAD-dependent malic enzyme [Sessilibacter sp. MAH1]
MKQRPLYVPFAGPALLDTPLLNKGSAFTQTEREHFNLVGLIPHTIETIEEQKERAYEQLNTFTSDISKHIYLRNIQDTNETLFYRLMVDHLEEIIPLIYIPTVAQACQQFSHIYRRHRGLFISYPDLDNLDDVLQNATKHNVKTIVVTDGERILGLGDQGIGGMGIPIGKLSLYVACGGISPAYTLPVVLDAGCNNEKLINDPLYMGWRHRRITGDEYDEFIDEFVAAVKRRWPNALLQFEDFAQTNATYILNRYKDKLCCFNDDIQGTAAATLASVIAASRYKNQKLSEQTVCILGAGPLGCNIAELLVEEMVSEGLKESQARAKIYMVDRWGLLQDKMANLQDFQSPFAQSKAALKGWKTQNTDAIGLIDVVTNAKPSVLIGVSSQPGLFSEAVVSKMHEHCDQPVIMPLSNPTSGLEAEPRDLLRWTRGQAIVATGVAFPPVNHAGELFEIAQCSSSFIFPGLGLGVISSMASRITDGMIKAAARALASLSPLANRGSGALLPSIADSRSISPVIAKAVYRQAILDGVSTEVTDAEIDERVVKNFWKPEYRNYKRAPF